MDTASGGQQRPRGGVRRRLELQTLVLQSGIATFYVVGAATGLFGAEDPWRTAAITWIVGYHVVHALYVLAWRAKRRLLAWMEVLTPIADVGCITLAWLSLGDPYSPLWAIYLYLLVGYSRRFRGKVFLGLSLLVLANLALGGMYLSHQRSGALLDVHHFIGLAMTAFMAMLANTIGDGWREAEMRARELANTDPLTGIANRRTFLEGLERLAELPQSAFSLLMLDLDNFKQLNDRYGHIQGDAVLAKAAAVMAANLRPGDSVARYGGEEFVVLLPRTGRAQARRVAERLREAIQQETPTSVSVGCATRQWGEGAEELVRRADELLLQAKRSGKNRVVAETEPLAA